MSEYIDLAYPVHEEMPIYPGLPKTQVKPREDIEKGDKRVIWNGSKILHYPNSSNYFVSIYKHHYI